MLPHDYEIPDCLSREYFYDMLSCFTIPHSRYFDGLPVSVTDAANKWFNSTWSYFVCISSPPALDLVVELKESLRLIFLTRFRQMEANMHGKNNIEIFASCFEDFCTAVANAFSPVYTTVHAIPKVNLRPVESLGKVGGTSEQCIDLLTTIVHGYFISHTSTLIVEPHTVFPWL